MKIDEKKFIEYSKLEVFKKKLQNTYNLIEKTLENFKNPYVSYSTGKDSLVLLTLCKKVKNDIPIMFHDSGLELPESYEIINKLKSEGYNIDIVKSPISILDSFKKHNTFFVAGYESDKSFTLSMKNPIIEYQKETNKDLAIIGLRKQESKRREIMINKYGELFFCKSYDIYHFFPLSKWTTKDIFAFIFSNNLKEYLHPAYTKTNFSDIEKIRISWFCDPTTLTRGNILWLKYYYPELYNKLSIGFPEIKSYV